MAKPMRPSAPALVEPRVNASCVELCVTCGDTELSDANKWPLANSLSCLVGAGCVVLPDEGDDDFFEKASRSRKEAAPGSPRTTVVGGVNLDTVDLAVL